MTTCAPPGYQEPHEYLSTSCFHGEHDYCKSTLTDHYQHKFPAECKFCSAPCICPCHDEDRK